VEFYEAMKKGNAEIKELLRQVFRKIWLTKFMHGMGSRFNFGKGMDTGMAFR
jgi:hypothetical protein